MVQEKGLIHVEMSFGGFDMVIKRGVIGVEFLVDFEVKEFLPVVEGIDKKGFELGDVEEDGEFVEEGGDE